MVRLKENLVCAELKVDKISIPYGAIKRIEEQQNVLQELHFNSLWCD